MLTLTTLVFRLELLQRRQQARVLWRLRLLSHLPILRGLRSRLWLVMVSLLLLFHIQ